jgi:hypothetical protein
MSERDVLFEELGANWQSFQENDDLPILSAYPLLSRLDDVCGDAVYKPAEIDALLSELMRAENVVTDLAATRGIEKLKRIARWAHKSNRGIYFAGE